LSKSVTPLPRRSAPGGSILHPEDVRGEISRIDRLLIIRLRSLGDSVLTLPLLQALHDWRPDLALDILIEPPFAPVFQHHPAVHETRVLQTGPLWRGKLRALAEIRRRKYPAVLNLHGGTTSLLFSMAGGARLRIGQERFRGGGWYNVRIPESAAVWGRPQLHTVEHQLTLLKWLRLPVPEDPRPSIHLGPSARERINARLRSDGLQPGGFLLIQPTATLATKQWAVQHFARLADLLTEMSGYPAVFSAGAWEADVLRRIEENARHRHRFWTGLGLEDLFALIDACRLFIGNDSGPTHAAAALAKPVVVVWGSSDFQVWRPWGTDYESVRSELPCMPCSGYTCTAYGEPRCILDISVERVLDACRRMLARS
jgi:ADP-heptose:LPS heptosyltransferase